MRRQGHGSDDGPPRASDVLRECLYMGADEAYLITDRKFAGADTLATSYVLSEAIKKIGNYDFVFAGRQAIDGDTAQVGPQTAEKLNIPQVTYAERILEIKDRSVRARRKIDGGYEILDCVLPVLMTVLKDAGEPRPFSAKRVMAYKVRSRCWSWRKWQRGIASYIDKLVFEYTSRSLFVPTLTADDLNIDASRCGVKGSPTKVYSVESVVLTGNDPVRIENSKAGMNSLIEKLLEDRILG